MNVVVIILAMGFVCTACFLAGAKVGQATAKGEKVELPTINPMQAVRDHRAKKEAEMEQDRVGTILQNIETYDGTSRGQVDVPGR
jgi:hypothetical protein